MKVLLDFPEAGPKGRRPDGWVRFVVDNDTQDEIDEMALELRVELQHGRRRRDVSERVCRVPIGKHWPVKLSSLGRFSFADVKAKPPGGLLHFRVIGKKASESEPAIVLAEASRAWLPGANRWTAGLALLAALAAISMFALSAPSYNAFAIKALSQVLAFATFLQLSFTSGREWIISHLLRAYVALIVFVVSIAVLCFLFTKIHVVGNLSPMPSRASGGAPAIAPGHARLTWGKSDGLLHTGQAWHGAATEEGPAARAAHHAALRLQRASIGTQELVFPFEAHFLSLFPFISKDDIVCERGVPDLFHDAWKASGHCGVSQPLGPVPVELQRAGSRGAGSPTSTPVLNLELTWRHVYASHYGVTDQRDLAITDLLRRHFIQLKPRDATSLTGFLVEMQGSGLVSRVRAKLDTNGSSPTIPTPTEVEDSAKPTRVGMTLWLGEAPVGSLEVWGHIGTSLNCIAVRTSGARVSQLLVRAGKSARGPDGEGDGKAYNALFQALNTSLTDRIPLCLPEVEGATMTLELTLDRGFSPDRTWTLSVPSGWTGFERVAVYEKDGTRLGTLKVGEATDGDREVHIGPLHEGGFALPSSARICAAADCPPSAQSWEGNPDQAFSKGWFWWRWTEQPPDTLYFQGYPDHVLTRTSRARLASPNAATGAAGAPGAAERPTGADYRLKAHCGPCRISITGERYHSASACPKAERIALDEAHVNRVVHLKPCCAGRVIEICSHTPRTP